MRPVQLLGITVHKHDRKARIWCAVTWPGRSDGAEVDAVFIRAGLFEPLIADTTKVGIPPNVVIGMVVTAPDAGIPVKHPGP